MFNPTPGARRQLGLISPGKYPKLCALEIISGDAFPPEWQGSIITCDFRANRVTRFRLDDQGSGFVTQQEDDLMRTSASTFRPIDVKQGPDGALYIADWSNPIINHGEVDFRDQRRDRWHGRIWRVTWTGAEEKKRVNLRTLPTEQLLDNLVRDDRYMREQSRRVLIERGDIGPALDRWIDNQQDEFARLQGMWLYQARGALDKLPLDLLTADDPRVRAAAVRVVGDFADPATDHPHRFDWQATAETVGPRVLDEHPRVRLEAIRALGKIGTADAAALALESLAKPSDRFLDFALALTIDQCSGPLMKAIESGAWTAETASRRKQLAFVLTAIDPADATQFLAERLEQSGLPRDGSGPWIELVGKAGGPGELRRLLDQVVEGGFNAKATRAALDALTEAAELRKVRPSGSRDGLGQLLANGAPAVKAAAARLAGAWELRGQIDRLAELAANADAPVNLRHTAVEAIRKVGGGKAADALADLATSPQAEKIRRQTTIALAALDPSRVGEPFFSLLAKTESENDAFELWRDVLRGRGVGPALASTLADGKVSKVAARAGVRACRDSGREEPELLATLLPLSGMSLTSDKLTPEEMQKMMRRVKQEGDPHRGESVYMREELQCVNCHAIGGVGGNVGPDMTSLGASAPLDYIIKSLFDPNAKIKEGFHATTVLTADGRVISGIEVESTDSQLVLRNAENELVKIPQADVLETKQGKSLMPTGVIDRLPPQDRIDLISFLSRLGKPGAFDASGGGVARIYDVFAGTHRAEQQGAERLIRGKVEKGWKPLIARVNGDVARGRLQALTKQPVNISLVHVYLRTAIEVANAGPVTLQVSAPPSAALWIDGQSVEGDRTFKSDLEAGRHTVLVRLDTRELPESFRLSSSDVTFATERNE